MFEAYSEKLPASEALQATFSGQDLCGACLAAQDIHANMDDVNLFLSGGIPLLWIAKDHEARLTPPGICDLVFIAPDGDPAQRVRSIEPPPPKALA